MGQQDLYRFGSGFSEEGLQVPASEQLEDDETGMLVEADPDEVDDIGVMEFGHDDGLHEKVHFRLIGRYFRESL